MITKLPQKANIAIESLSSMGIHLKSDVGVFEPFGVLIDISGEASYYSLSTDGFELDGQPFFELLIASLKEETGNLDVEFAGICLDMSASFGDDESQDVFGFYVESRRKEFWFLVQPYTLDKGNLQVGDYVEHNSISLLELF